MKTYRVTIYKKVNLSNRVNVLKKDGIVTDKEYIICTDLSIQQLLKLMDSKGLLSSSTKPLVTEYTLNNQAIIYGSENKTVHKYIEPDYTIEDIETYDTSRKQD